MNEPEVDGMRQEDYSKDRVMNIRAICDFERGRSWWTSDGDE